MSILRKLEHIRGKLAARADSVDAMLEDYSSQYEGNIEYYYMMYMKMLHCDADDDDDEDSKKGGKKGGHVGGGGGAMYKLPYGLCKNAGIDTTGLTPTEAWEALKSGTGVGHDDVLKSLKKHSEDKAKAIKKAEKSVKHYEDKLKKYGNMEPTDPDTGEVNEAGKALLDMKGYGKKLTKLKKNNAYYKEKADFWKKRSEMSYEQFANHSYLSGNLEGDELKEAYEKKIAMWEGLYKQAQSDYENGLEEEKKMTEALETAKAYSKDKKLLVKKQAELEAAKHSKAHFSEETEQKGAEAKSAYNEKKKAE